MLIIAACRTRFKGLLEKKSWAWSLLVVATLSGTPVAAQLPGPVVDALRRAGIPPEQIAVQVQEVGAPRPWLQQNPDRPMNPASVMKLVVTYAALEQLGPAYRWRTETYIDRTPQPGSVPALYLKGYGDPKLTLEAFWLMLRGLRDRGIRDIKGDLIVDRSRFEIPPHDPGAFDGEAFRAYNTGPDALLLNFKATRFQVVPAADTGAQVHVSPALRALDLINAIRVTEGPCGNWRDGLITEFRAFAGGMRAVFAGPYPRSCGVQVVQASLFSPNEYLAGVFRNLWEELGGNWSGSVRDGLVPDNASLVLSYESASLAEVVRDINKFSNNVMARQLYLTLGLTNAPAGVNPSPARPEAGFQAVRAALTRRGLDMPELVIENGAGLSRIDRISARSLSRLLLAAFSGPNMADFMASLPLLAIDGTMRRRLKDSPLAGQAHIKGGTLSDVRAIAGYVLDRSGTRHSVVMMVNHPAAGRIQAAQDTLLTWVYNRGQE